MVVLHLKITKEVSGSHIQELMICLQMQSGVFGVSLLTPNGQKKKNILAGKEPDEGFSLYFPHKLLHQVLRGLRSP